MSKLIVALDVNDLTAAFELIDILSPKVKYFKVGMVPFVNFGDQLLAKLEAQDCQVFLDLKFHDIPNTVQQAVQVAVKKNIFMLNVHCLGGLKMLTAAVAGLGAKTSISKPLLIGVTILTSMNEEDFITVGLKDSVDTNVLRLATLAKQAGLDGVVASAREASLIKQYLGNDFLVVTPGIRPLWSLTKKDDQMRIVTPAQAKSAGADFIVVGRPIIEAKDPLVAATDIIAELENT